MNAIVPQEQNQMSAEAIIVRAIEQNVSVDTMERLLAMRDRIKAEQAREQYYTAMAAFQSECPQIKKGREVKGKDGKVRYSYANLEDIISQVSPLLKKHGLSFAIRSELKDGFIVATCETHHVGGHAGESSFPVPIEKDAFMNDAQKAGSANTYAKRIAFCNAFGIVTGDYDDDAQSLGVAVSAQDIYRKAKTHVDAVYEHYESIRVIRESLAIGNLSQAAEAWEELSNEAKMKLWIAPTKGGIFSTEERKTIHSDEFAAIRRQFAEPTEGENA